MANGNTQQGQRPLPQALIDKTRKQRGGVQPVPTNTRDRMVRPQQTAPQPIKSVEDQWNQFSPQPAPQPAQPRLRGPTTPTGSDHLYQPQQGQRPLPQALIDRVRTQRGGVQPVPTNTRDRMVRPQQTAPQGQRMSLQALTDFKTRQREDAINRVRRRPSN